jgi:hypothetical protein
MAATLVDLSGYTFGITSNETGMNVESVSHKASSKKIEVVNKDGETTGLVYHDPKVEISLSGETTATIATAVGATLTVANLLSLGGVSSGAVLLDEITIEEGREALRKVSITATRYPQVTAA